MNMLSTLQIGAGWFTEQPGGLDRYFHELIAALPDAGVECRGLVVGTQRVATESGGRVQAFASREDSLLKRWLAARHATKIALRELGPDCLVSAHFSLYARPALSAIIDQNRPIVVHFHGPWAAESRQEGECRFTSWIKHRVENALYRHAVAFITLSNSFRDVLCRQYGIDPSRVHVIPGGVDVQKFEPARKMSRQDARRQMNLPLDRPIVATVRRLAGRMGLENLIDAMHLVRKKVPDALCILAGRGRLKEALAQRIADCGLQDHVLLPGFVPDDQLPMLYRAADVTVMPSSALEGFGLSAIESLAAGTPVLVTPVGGLPEVVKDLDARLVIPSGGQHELCDSIVAALSSPDALPSSRACIAYVDEKFQWPAIARRVRAVYAAALNRESILESDLPQAVPCIQS